ncbi:nesprin-3 isoform X2 [Brienomyrus brachyistius]|uniref:nesprin-3 isoform X2 n=1 Tax=Brienomyrus brachyistius TaxID=42636 RepID=UPI0020B200A3|nr:nesprin-3 isoform X2 [Brienomyrus brachyistius]
MGAARNEWQPLPGNPYLWVCIITVCQRVKRLRQQSFIYIRPGLRFPACCSTYVAMTQQEQAEFGHSLEAAMCWMRAAHERLRVIDNTQGPREALEARLRETEAIRESEYEGRIKMDRVLAVADALLKSRDEEVKRETHGKLKELKAFWDETTTYITHCHCRIEWVWLHWSEYLKVHEEFAVWLGKMRCTLEPQLELQLDLREKLWQLDHHQVLLSDVHGQAALLERLLEEALALYSRTEDPSVGPEALQDAYNQIRDKAAERVALLQKIVKDHQTYEGRGQGFLAWLASRTAELNDCNEAEDPEKKLQDMQDLWKSVSCEEETLRDMETLAEAVKAQTSPAGAEAIAKEVEHLREAWEKLMQCLLLEQERLQVSQRSIADHEARVEQLRADVAQHRRVLQAQGRELEASGGERTEEEMVTAWRKCTKVYAALAMEEPAVERMKTRLRELFHFSQGSTGPLSDDVVAMIKEYQGVKSRAFQLSTEAETDLQKVLQDPLRGYKQWTSLASEVLRSSEEMSEFSHLALLVQKMEKLLKHSLQLQERLSLLQVKGDLLSSVFGPDKAGDILTELSAAMKEREQLHSQLAQKKRHLQDLLQKSNGFGEAYNSISKQLDQIKERLNAADGLQPDILAKKSQFDQFVIMKKDLEDCEAHVTALETLVSSLTNRHMFDQLHAEWRELYKTVRVKMNESERSIAEHENFHENLLTVEKWLMIMRQKLESFCGADGEWSVQNRRTEAERALGEFPEKELQLHKTEAQGQIVLSRTSEEGKVHILRDLHRLRESWLSLHSLSLNVFRLLSGEGAAGVREVSPIGGMVEKIGSDRESSLTESEDAIKGNRSELGLGCGISGEGYDAGWDALIGAEGAGPSTRSEFAVGRKPLGNSDVDLQSRVAKGEGSRIQCEEPDGIDLRVDHGPSGKGLHLVEDMVEKTPKTMTVAGAGGKSGGSFGFGGDFGVERSSGSSVKAEKSAAGTSFWVEASSDSDAGKKPPKGGGQRRAEDSKQRGTSDYDSWRGAGLDVWDSPSGSGQEASGKYAQESHEWNKWQNKGGDAYAVDKTLKLRSGGEIGAEDESSGDRRRTTKDRSVHRKLIPDPEFQCDTKLLREFEVWLKAENEKLSKILGQKGQKNAAERKEREQTLKDLRSRVGWGQSQLQRLLALWGVGAVTAQAEELEELRYHWMLYKSKLKEAGDLSAPLQPTDTRVRREESVMMRKRSKFLSRVCCVALPLQLLLLGLLLLAFLLPLTDEGASCSLANNFARSFSIMLRYHGPPPT